MKMLLILGITMATLVAVQAQVQLSENQQVKLFDAAQGFSQQSTLFEGLMQNKLTELAIELQREGRLSDESSAVAASERVNAILMDLGNLYGEFIKTKVQFVLKAKNALTDEQKMYFLSQLNPSDSLTYKKINFLQPELFDLPLNLSLEQEKKLIVLESDLMIEETKIECHVSLTLLDLRPVLMSGQMQPEIVDPLVLELANLAARSIDNRVSFFLKAKDVLTRDQKRLMAHMMGLD
ncbi:MAG: hypothetical protein V5783_06125 [Pontiella sp.]